MSSHSSWDGIVDRVSSDETFDCAASVSPAGVFQSKINVLTS
jgi:hypothetical protein